MIFLQPFDAWLNQCCDLLEPQNLRTGDVRTGDWSYSWHEAWRAGTTPADAVDEALALLVDQGALDQVLAIGRLSVHYSRSVGLMLRCADELSAILRRQQCSEQAARYEQLTRVEYKLRFRNNRIWRKLHQMRGTW